jgi:hypothetical protein
MKKPFIITGIAIAHLLALAIITYPLYLINAPVELCSLIGVILGLTFVTSLIRLNYI